MNVKICVIFTTALYRKLPLMQITKSISSHKRKVACHLCVLFVGQKKHDYVLIKHLMFAHNKIELHDGKCFMLCS